MQIFTCPFLEEETAQRADREWIKCQPFANQRFAEAELRSPRLGPSPSPIPVPGATAGLTKCPRPRSTTRPLSNTTIPDGAINLQPWVRLSMNRGACPAGATELSPGFQPWEPSNKVVRLKGRETRVPDEAHLLPRKSQSAQ